MHSPLDPNKGNKHLKMKSPLFFASAIHMNLLQCSVDLVLLSLRMFYLLNVFFVAYHFLLLISIYFLSLFHYHRKSWITLPIFNQQISTKIPFLHTFCLCNFHVKFKNMLGLLSLY